MTITIIAYQSALVTYLYVTIRKQHLQTLNFTTIKLPVNMASKRMSQRLISPYTKLQSKNCHILQQNCHILKNYKFRTDLRSNAMFLELECPDVTQPDVLSQNSSQAAAILVRSAQSVCESL